MEVEALQLVAHPVRVVVLTRLADGEELSPKQVAAQGSSTLGTTAYHFRILLNAGLIRETRRVKRRGAFEHFYRLAGRRRRDAERLLAAVAEVRK